MSSVYYSLALTAGPPLIAAQLYSDSLWTTPAALSDLQTYLQSLDFSSYEARRLALSYIDTLPIPKFFETYPFDPLAYPLAPPIKQVRFPADGSFVRISSIEWASLFSKFSRALAFRDSDGPIGPSLIIFESALDTFASLFNSLTSFFDRSTFEVSLVLIWGIYPPLP